MSDDTLLDTFVERDKENVAVITEFLKSRPETWVTVVIGGAISGATKFSLSREEAEGVHEGMVTRVQLLKAHEKVVEASGSHG